MKFNRVKFKQIRELKMTPAQLAARLGVNPSTVRGWERELDFEPRSWRYAAIAAALGCEVADFCDDDEEPVTSAPEVGELSDAERLLVQMWREEPHFQMVVELYRRGCW